MSRGTGWGLGAALVAAALAAWWLLRAGTPAEAPPPLRAPEVLHVEGAAAQPAAGLAPLQSRAPAPLGGDAKAPPAPQPAADPTAPRLSVRWIGAPVPMTRDPLPKFEAQPSSGAARLAGRRAQEALSADGSAVMLAVGAGPNDLVLRSGGAAVWRDQRDVRAGTTEIELDAAHLPGVAGRCVDEQGRPMEGVTVRINSVITSSVVSVTSGADGTFRVPFLSAELLYDGKASKPGYREATTDPLQLQPDRVTVMEPFVMRAARVVSGRVELPDGSPVASCPVSATVVKLAHAQASTDADGRFRFDDLPPGDVRVFTTHSMLRDAFVLLPDAAEERHAVLVLDEGVFIDGTVRSEDGSATTGFVWIQGVPQAAAGGPAPDREASSQTAQVSGIPGTFKLGPFPPGPVEISDGFHAFEPLVVNAPGTVELVLPVQRTMDVELRFTDATTGQPISKRGSYGMLIIDPAGNGSQGGPPLQPDDNGVWRLRQKLSPLVSASIVVRFGGYLPARVDGLEALPAPAPRIEVAVKPDPGFTVRVLDAGGAPVAGASVFTSWRVESASISERMAAESPSFAIRKWFADGAALVSHGSSDADGFARLSRVEDGAMVCAVTAEGFLSWFQRFATAPTAPSAQTATPAQASSAAATPADLIVTLTRAP